MHRLRGRPPVEQPRAAAERCNAKNRDEIATMGETFD